LIICSLWWRMVCRVREGISEGVEHWFDENVCRVVSDGRGTLFWYDNWIGEFPLRLKFSRLFALSVSKESTVEEMLRLGWEEDGLAWVWRRRLLAWEEGSVRECAAMSNNLVLQENVHDTWRWQLDPICGYSVKKSYRYITNSEMTLDRTLANDVWLKQIPSKVSLLVWRLLRNRLPTKDNLLRRRVINGSALTCVVGCEAFETTLHLFLNCGVSSVLWADVRMWLGIFTVTPSDIRLHFQQFTKMAGMPRSSHLFFSIIWFVVISVIWKERNNRVFENVVATPFMLLERVKLNSFLWMKSKNVPSVTIITTGGNIRLIVWA